MKLEIQTLKRLLFSRKRLPSTRKVSRKSGKIDKRLSTKLRNIFMRRQAAMIKRYPKKTI